MKKNNMTCRLCSKKYTYCPNCGEFSNLPTWMNMFDKENCKNIYFACSDYFFDKDLAKAKSVLDNCDLSDRENFDESTKNILNEIMVVDTVQFVQPIEEVVHPLPFEPIDEVEVPDVVEELPEINVEETIDSIDEFMNEDVDTVEEVADEVDNISETKKYKKRRYYKKSEN